jgi:hypothetical protein
MKQHSLGLGMTAQRTRRREFLDEMERVVPCPRFVDSKRKHLGPGMHAGAEVQWLTGPVPMLAAVRGAAA